MVVVVCGMVCPHASIIRPVLLLVSPVSTPIPVPRPQVYREHGYMPVVTSTSIFKNPYLQVSFALLPAWRMCVSLDDSLGPGVRRSI